MEETLREQHVETGIGNQRYALKIYDIHEIIKMQEITEIPNTRPYVKGVINLRGKIVPIISLRNRFAMPEQAYTKTTRIVVVNHRDEMVGIVVDQVNQVVAFSDIQPSPERIGSVQGSFFTGIGRTETGLVSILNLDRVLHE